jgi:peptide/nickel transport system substrate-binding protein
MNKRIRKSALAVSMLLLLSLVAAACGPAPTATSPATAATATPVAVQPTTAPGQPTATTAPAQPTATSAPQATATSAATPVAMKNPGTIIYATIGDPQTLDPAWAYDTASGQIIFNVYETLVFPKRESVTEFVPMLATTYTVSSDAMTYTFTIRKGVKFQQGQDLTPEDVAYSFWRGMIQDRAGGPQWIMLQPFFGLDVTSFQDDVVTKQFNGDFAAAAKAVEEAVTYDNNAGTVTLHLKQPFGPMLQILSGSWASIVSKPWVISLGGWDGDPATAEKFHDPAANADELFDKMNGTGPYVLERWAPGQEIDLTANPNYWVTEPLWPGGPTGPASIGRAVIQVISEWGTRFAEFQTGDADIVYVPRQYISQIDPLVKDTCDASGNCTTTNPNGIARLFKGLPNVAEDAIYFNQATNNSGGNNFLGSGKLDGNGVPPDFFSDVHIRKAFNYCFDWDTYIKQVWNGEAIQAYGPIIQGELGYDPNQAHYSFDLQKCTDEFNASTLKSADGKSVMDTGFYLQYIYNTGNDQRKSAGDILAANLLKVNPKFHLEVVGEPFALELSDQVASRLPLFMLGWIEDYHDPNDWVVPFLSSGGAYSAFQGFAKDLQTQLDQLITQAVSTADTQKRAQIYAQLQNLSYENALDLYVDQPLGRWYEQMWIGGYYYNPIFGANAYFYVLTKG